MASEWPDLVNGLFELLGGFAIWPSIVKAWRNKSIASTHWATVIFFFLWGVWNLFYYPHLGQWLSFAGGIWITFTNICWIGVCWKYGRNQEA